MKWHAKPLFNLFLGRGTHQRCSITFQLHRRIGACEDMSTIYIRLVFQGTATEGGARGKSNTGK